MPHEGRVYGPTANRPLSVPPQRKHNKTTSQPDVHSNVENAGFDAEINNCLKATERTTGLRAGVELPASTRASQRKLLHEEIALLWAMSTSASRDVVFSNAW